MKKMAEVTKPRWLLIAMVCLISFGAVSVSTSGCAGSTKTSTVTTQTTDAGSSGASSVSTQKEVTTSAHPRGVIGGIFYTIGQILLWPFKLIGSLF